MSLEDHGEVPEEMSPLPVDGVLEARVVGVQVRAVHQHLLAVVQVTDHLRGVITSASKSSIRRFVITEKAPTWAFSWLKAATTAFTFKTLLRHYAKQALTPWSHG